MRRLPSNENMYVTRIPLNLLAFENCSPVVDNLPSTIQILIYRGKRSRLIADGWFEAFASEMLELITDVALFINWKLLACDPYEAKGGTIVMDRLSYDVRSSATRQVATATRP